MKKIAISLLCLSSLCVGQIAIAKPATPSVQAQQSQAIGQIFQQLSQHAVVRAKFTQQKKLPNLAKTFQSSGQILFAKNQGVLWQISAPVQADLIMTQRALVQKTANTQSKINLEQNQYAGVAHLFLQLMAGNQTAFTQNFNIHQANYSAQGWQLQLSPKSSTMKKLFEQVEISGKSDVNKIVITEKNKGQTTILFNQHQHSPVQLTGTEHALFQLAK